MTHIFLLDARDLLSEVEDFGPGLDQSVQYNIPVEINHRDSCKPLTFSC